MEHIESTTVKSSRTAPREPKIYQETVWVKMQVKIAIWTLQDPADMLEQ
jgi:hypothetical protein